MAKQPHISETIDQAIVDEAVNFTAFVQMAPGDRRRIDCKTMAEAERAAAAGASQLNRKILIYATNQEGRTAFVKAIRPIKHKDI
jgi:hypothetical protein